MFSLRYGLIFGLELIGLYFVGLDGSVSQLYSTYCNKFFPLANILLNAAIAM